MTPGPVGGSRGPAEVDDLGRRVILATAARRVVSLVPSLTETLFAVGAGGSCVGATRFCVYPEAARALPRVGGTKTADPDAILRCRPDLVLVSVDENRAPDAEALEAAGVPVFATHPRSLPEIGAIIRRVGRLTGRAGAADRLADQLGAEAAAIERCVAGRPRPRVLTLVWKGPWMTVGERTFMADLVRRAGGTPVGAPAGDAKDWPALDDAALRASAPDVILLNTEPYHFTDEDVTAMRAAGDTPAACDGRVWLLDGQLTTWAGPRIVEGLRAVASVLHPGAMLSTRAD